MFNIDKCAKVLNFFFKNIERLEKSSESMQNYAKLVHFMQYYDINYILCDIYS